MVTLWYLNKIKNQPSKFNDFRTAVEVEIVRWENQIQTYRENCGNLEIKLKAAKTLLEFPVE